MIPIGMLCRQALRARRTSHILPPAKTIAGLMSTGNDYRQKSWVRSVLHVRGVNRDDSGIIFLISESKHML